MLKGVCQRFQIMVLVIIDLVFFNINKNHGYEITMKLKGKILIADDFSGYPNIWFKISPSQKKNDTVLLDSSY